MKFQRKYWGLLSTLGVSSAVALSACAAQARDVYVTSSASDLLKNNLVPMSMFNVSPTSSFFGSKYAGLTTYIATGSNKDDGVNVTSQTQEKLVLELATSVKGYKKKTSTASNMKTASVSSSSSSTGNNGSTEDEWEVVGSEIKRESGKGDNGKSITEDSNFQTISQQATRYEFTIDTSIKWVDNNGKPVKDEKGQEVKLSSKDFERGFEAYILSSELRFNRNGYFIDLMGLDVEKTVGMTNGKNGTQVKKMTTDSSSTQQSEEKKIEITDDNYDPEDYRSTSDDKFNVYLTSPFPFLLSMMSKEFFFPIPHTHPKVKAIKVGPNSPLVYNEKNSAKILDQTKTNFDGIYGGGGGVNAWRDAWSVGPYYVESFNQSQIVFKRNKEYDDHITPNLPKTREGNEQPIPTMINYFQPGATPEVFYSNYIAGGLSSAGVSYSQQEDARSRFASTGDLRWVKVQKTAQSAQITYSSRPYILEGETVKTNSNITETEAKFLYNSESEEALTIRAGINGLINWQNLAIILLPNSGDLNYSIVPFGIFKEKGKDVQVKQKNTGQASQGSDLMNDYYYKI